MEWIPRGAAEALGRLMEGNAAHLRGEAAPAQAPAERARLAEDGQRPYACVVCCADSRVPPEVLFRAGPGEIFVVRNAGNVVDSSVRDSVAYALRHLRVPLVLVMGHTRCGAVESALEGESAFTFDAVRSHISGGDARGPEAENALGAVRDLLSDPSVAEAVSAGGAAVAAALCDTGTGRVEILRPPKD